jgi:hypothetical protein
MGTPGSGCGGPDPDDAPETERERRLTNILIVGFVLFVIAAGFWLGNAMLEARRADECLSSGRRNCTTAAPPTIPKR